MNIQSIPEKALQELLDDAASRDRATARRLHLYHLLWNERYLTRAQLIVRLEAHLGRGCFGEAAWEDTFYRDMRIVKRAFQKAGYTLKYSRNQKTPGYYLHDHPPLQPALAQAIAGSVREVDPSQIAIFKQQTPAVRFRQGASITDIARRVVQHRSQSGQSGPARE